LGGDFVEEIIVLAKSVEEWGNKYWIEDKLSLFIQYLSEI